MYERIPHPLYKWGPSIGRKPSYDGTVIFRTWSVNLVQNIGVNLNNTWLTFQTVQRLGRGTWWDSVFSTSVGGPFRHIQIRRNPNEAWTLFAPHTDSCWHVFLHTGQVLTLRNPTGNNTYLINTRHKSVTHKIISCWARADWDFCITRCRSFCKMNRKIISFHSAPKSVVWACLHY